MTKLAYYCTGRNISKGGSRGGGPWVRTLPLFLGADPLFSVGPLLVSASIQKQSQHILYDRPPPPPDPPIFSSHFKTRVSFLFIKLAIKP